MTVRSERPGDVAAIRGVNLAAFAGALEADLVDALRVQARPIISLVADDSGSITGHILFSPVTLSASSGVKIMGLAPMAVLPTRQREGIGSALVSAGLDACQQLGFLAVVVLGHAKYYPRFGFEPASRFGILCEYDVPDDVFMALELEPNALNGKTGIIRYHAAFANA